MTRGSGGGAEDTTGSNGAIGASGASDAMGSTRGSRAAAPHVLIVGGGGTGGAIAHDLSLRGLRVTLVERGDIASGSTGRHHGLLHSGARYVTTDRSSAIECSAENKILRRICPGSFEENDGLYVAISDEDVAFADRFLEACWQCAVPAKRIDRETALRMEPRLSPALRFAVQVPDATMDAMRVPLRFFATARRHGAEIKPFTEVMAVTMTGRTVTGVAVRDHSTGRNYEIGADVVINAAGPWAGEVAALAEVKVPLVLSPGVMVAIRGRHCNMAVSRLSSPGDGDALVPQRGLTIAGTSSWIATDPDDLSLPQDDVAMIVRQAALMIPSLATAEIRAVWASVRPLIGVPEPRPRRRARAADTASRTAADPSTDGAADGRAPIGQVGRPSRGRELGRGMRCLDHATDATPTQGFVTVAGGKATTLRAMAEVTADLVCAKLGLDCRCETADYVLLPHTAWYGA